MTARPILANVEMDHFITIYSQVVPTIEGNNYTKQEATELFNKYIATARNNARKQSMGIYYILRPISVRQLDTVHTAWAKENARDKRWFSIVNFEKLVSALSTTNAARTDFSGFGLTELTTYMRNKLGVTFTPNTLRMALNKVGLTLDSNNRVAKKNNIFQQNRIDPNTTTTAVKAEAKRTASRPVTLVEFERLLDTVTNLAVLVADMSKKLESSTVPQAPTSTSISEAEYIASQTESENFQRTVSTVQVTTPSAQNPPVASATAVPDDTHSDTFDRGFNPFSSYNS